MNGSPAGAALRAVVVVQYPIRGGHHRGRTGGVPAVPGRGERAGDPGLLVLPGGKASGGNRDERTT